MMDFSGSSIFWLVSVSFTVWMLIYCLKNDPDRYLWMWVILFFPSLGPLLYFFIRYLPTKSFRSSPVFRRFARGKELKQLEWKCRQIGNAHQWVAYGEALKEVGKWDDADKAFQEAVTREGTSLPARWGAAQVAHRNERLEDAREHLEFLLQQDERYKFGDPSLLLGKTLMALGDNSAAKKTLEQHVTAHRTPEAVYLFATLQAEDGETEEARKTLVSLIDDLENAPRAIVRKSMFWRSRAKQLLKRLP